MRQTEGAEPEGPKNEIIVGVGHCFFEGPGSRFGLLCPPQCELWSLELHHGISFAKGLLRI